MGANMAPNYANIFMHDHEEQIVLQNILFSHFIFWYCRYVDDIFFVWKGSREKLLQFADYVNRTHNTTKFVLHFYNTQIEFLDVHVSQLMRCKRITSTNDNYLSSKEKMLDMFRKKGYPKPVLRKAEDEVDKLTREALLSIKKKEERCQRIPFVSTYDTHSKRNCNSIIKGNTVLHPTQGTPIKLRGYHTCLSKNVIYYLKCPRGKGYVEKTNRMANRMVRLRLNEHRSSIRNAHSRVTSVRQYWTECRYNVAQLRWQVLEEVKSEYTNSDKKLLQRECFWIWKLGTLAPKGLNESWGLNCFL
ncbi:hypothetical protein XELAEV_18031349mg [Xenopus laevis]|uniref:Reverse transcriptase domain-containing protein n=1 Tax=Xenopus laevis TaxID=8355 RepID=A0A974HFJ4_XENLA|nr:hypothetical protein XELAEV_18031349mg [Xenopus laevis]